MALINKESERMDRLIHDLMEFARLGRNDLRKRPVDLRQLVKSIIEDFRPQLRDRQVVWQVGDLGEVEADPNLLRYALANLIDNASKYSRRRPRAEIKIDLADGHSHEREAVIYVQDNGVGFDMAHAKRLFSPFQRLHNSKDYEGSGIGLASVRRIIQRHGGRVWF